MNSSRLLLRELPRKATSLQTRQIGSVVSGPPSYPMSNAEKLAHGFVFFIATSAYPTWVTVNIKNYRGQAE